MDDLSLLIVDDEALIRAGLRLLLDGAEGIRVVGEAADGGAAVRAVRTLAPDVVLMDIRMPVLDGIAATAEILRESPATSILVLTTFDAEATVLGALQAGAQGFLLKDTPPAELVAAVRGAAQGRIALSATATRRLIAAAVRAPEPARRRHAELRLAALSAREREVAEAIGRGATNAEIAAELFISLATVKSHVSRIMEKLPAENRVQIALCVYEAQESGDPTPRHDLEGNPGHAWPRSP